MSRTFLRRREISKSALYFEFSNRVEGFASAKAWIIGLATQNEKKKVVLGLEPTGFYWFVLATRMISEGISVVLVNPYAVKQCKEIEDNRQLKDDRKAPKLIANLVKDGNYGMPYLPEYMDAFGKTDGVFTLSILKVTPIPSDIFALGTDGLRDIWHEAKLRGRGYSRSNAIVKCTRTSVRLKDGADAERKSIRWFAE